MATWMAVCEKKHILIVGWTGDSRATKAEAEKDAAEHKKEYPDHPVEIVYEP